LAIDEASRALNGGLKVRNTGPLLGIILQSLNWI
jgi:hypothetical protein